MKLRNILLLSLLVAVSASDGLSQSTKPARGGAVIESGGVNGTADFYAQNNGLGFDEYSLIEFSLSKNDFEGNDLTAITGATLTLTVNDRFFSAPGDFSILFTPDSKAELGDYEGLFFTPDLPFGIDASHFSTEPVVVGTGSYPFEGEEGGGTEVLVTLDPTLFEAELIQAINENEPFHLLIGILETNATVATFSGVGNTYDPGDPALTITATSPGGINPEPAAYPADFQATAAFDTITASWTDVDDALGYVVQISDTSSFPGVTDGTPAVDDTDLSDGSGQLVVGPDVESVTFSGLEEDVEYFLTIFPYSNLGDDIDYKTDGTPPEASATTTALTVGDVLITQYYEGTANNKYLELTNVSGATVDLNDYVLVNFDNLIAEDWKSGIASASRTTALSGLSISPGQSIVVANPSAGSPIAAADAAVSDGQVTFFNGNDSVVLYSDGSQSLAALVDAVPFTNAGFEGGETSFLRISADPGFDLNAGTSVLDFPSVWQEVSTTDVDEADFGDDAFLGSSDLGNPPPQVVFVESAILAEEDEGTVSLTIELRNPDGNPVSVDVVFDSSGSSAALGDIGNYVTQTVEFGAGAGDGDQETITVSITDDAEEESTESAIFRLENLVTNGAAIVGSPGASTLAIQDNDTPVPNLFFSEIADPADDPSAKFVEIYNPTGSPVDLGAGQWHVVVYFNANSDGVDVALNGTVPAGGTFVIANTGFADANGSAPDQENGNINSNGDDNFELRFGGDSSSGVLVDVYGQPGTDGTDMSWEFENGRAVRLDSVASGSITFDPAEWSIQAPADFADGTPGTHPETILSSPTGVSATALSDSQIQVGFTAVSGNDVVVVFNTSGSFSAPSGTVPAVGDSFAGGTVFYVGGGTPPVHSGLSAATEYFYAFYSTDGTDYSGPAVASATTDAVGGLIASEDFSGTPPVQWVNQSADGVNPIFGWQVIDGEAVADGFDGPSDQAHYLVSPELDFSAATNPGIEFDYGEAYSGDSLQLLYSTDYSGSGVPTAGGDTWTPVSFVFQEDLDNPDEEFTSFSGIADLPAALEGESIVYLAFLYTADGSDAGSRQWFLDNLVVRSQPGSDPLADYLANFGLTEADLGSDAGDNDGLPVLLEYVVDGDPNAPDALRLRGFAFEEEGESPRLTLEFVSNRADEPAGVTIEVLGSNDLGLTDPFAPVSFEFLTPVDNGDGTFTHRYRQIAPIGDPGAKAFLRLRVTREVP